MARGRARIVKRPCRAVGFSHSFGAPLSVPGIAGRELSRVRGFQSQSNGLDQDIAGPPEKEMTMRGILLGALAVGVVVLGYLYWEETRNDASITIQAPKIELPR
jgi:hypothetical protein